MLNCDGNTKISIELNSLQLTKTNMQVIFCHGIRLHWLKLVFMFIRKYKSNYQYDYDGYFHAFVCSHIWLIFVLSTRVFTLFSNQNSKYNKWKRFNCRQMTNIWKIKLINYTWQNMFVVFNFHVSTVICQRSKRNSKWYWTLMKLISIQKWYDCCKVYGWLHSPKEIKKYHIK